MQNLLRSVGQSSGKSEQTSVLTDRILKLKLWDKPRALELLMRHFGSFVERHQHEVKITLEDLVAGSRELDPTA